MENNHCTTYAGMNPVSAVPGNSSLEPGKKSMAGMVRLLPPEETQQEANPDLHSLLAQIARGNHAAFARLYRRYLPLVIRYLEVSGFADKQLREDIVQEIFLIIWTKQKKWANIKHFNAYLYAMAKNLVIDEKNKAAPWRNRLQHGTSLENLPDNHTMETISCRETKKIYHLGINNLSPRIREAFLLSEEKGLKAREIAGLMHISLFTAKRHRADAINKLRQWLKDHIN